MGTVTKTRQSQKKLRIEDLPSLLVGCETEVPTRFGKRRYINFDNAASTPTFKPIVDAVNEFLKWYSNVHRGTGFKSQLSSWAFEESRNIVARFVGADLKTQVVLFTKNATEAINKLSHRLVFGEDDVVLTTLMEHHSNELPWRRVARVEHVQVKEDGTVSKEDFAAKLKAYGNKVKLVALTGASNVSGHINDIHYFARETHKAGAKLLIDGAQLVPHRPVDMKPHDKSECIDFLVFSAHKMYAPFGVGVLVGDRQTFEQGEPESVGGGVVDIVTLEEAYWTDLPDKEEAGTPDIIGVVALGKAIKLFEQLGWPAIIEHEAQLTAYALQELKKIPKVLVYGDPTLSSTRQRLGVIPMNVRGVPHSLTAAILSYEGGIGVRSGCFCAHLYVQSLLKCSDERHEQVTRDIRQRDRSDIPGAIRVSFGLYNTQSEIDEFVKMIQRIAEGDYSHDYVLEKESGEYVPANVTLNFEEYFRF